MKHFMAYIKLNAVVLIVYLSTSLYHLFNALKHFGAYKILNVWKPYSAYIILNTPKRVLH